MKKPLVILALGIFLPLTSYATGTQLWVNGVTEKSGWVDFNKDSYAGDLCWAAAASNVINWWQRQYKIRDDIPKEDEIWNTVKRLFDNEGDMPSNAIKWWLEGNWDVALKYEDATAGGYYAYDLYLHGYSRASDYLWNPIAVSYEEDSRNIINELKRGSGVTLSQSWQHEVTLWGVEYNSDNLITKMWLTDSDDIYDGYTSPRLFVVDCFEKDGKLGIDEDDYWHSGPEGPLYVSGYTFFRPTDFLERVSPPIPEPSAFGLLAGIGALALVASRRSRRRKYFSTEAFSLGERK